MKLNSKGWGFRMMAILMGILVLFLCVAIYLIYNYYDKISHPNANNKITTSYVDVGGR